MPAVCAEAACLYHGTVVGLIGMLEVTDGAERKERH